MGLLRCSMTREGDADIKLYKVITVLVFMYGSENWAIDIMGIPSQTFLKNLKILSDRTEDRKNDYNGHLI
jgi:hypothetical protein